MSDSKAPTREQLDEWKKMAEKATPGPWFAGKWHQRVTRSADSNGGDSVAHVYRDDGLPDAAFIAAARTAVPVLVAEVERLREALTEWVTVAQIGTKEKWKQGDGTPAISTLWQKMAIRARAALAEGSGAEDARPSIERG